MRNLDLIFETLENVFSKKHFYTVYIYLNICEILNLYNFISDHEFSKQKDNLKIEEGSFKLLKSEYKRSFKNFFDALKAINDSEVIIYMNECM